MKFADHLVDGFVVLVNVMDFFHPECRIGEWVVLGSFQGAQLKFRSRLIVFDLSDEVVFLHSGVRRAPQVGSHHVQTVRPVAAYIRWRKIQIAFEEQAHECALLKLGRLRSRALRHRNARSSPPPKPLPGRSHPHE